MFMYFLFIKLINWIINLIKLIFLFIYLLILLFIYKFIYLFIRIGLFYYCDYTTPYAIGSSKPDRNKKLSLFPNERAGTQASQPYFWQVLWIISEEANLST